MADLALPFTDTIANLERWERKHAGFLDRGAGRAPQRIPDRISEDGSTAPAAEGDALAQECFRLLMAMLRAAMTMTSASHQKAAFDRDLPEIIEVANLIATTRTA